MGLTKTVDKGGKKDMTNDKSIVKEENAYVLGTDREELHRLGFQHQVWAETSFRAWDEAGFTSGNTLLDLGCGPGFATRDLAYIVGQEGKVIAVDQSTEYLNFLDIDRKHHGLNIELRNCDFNELNLTPNSINGAYCRWALAWINNPKEIVQKVSDGLMEGGRFVIHEYVDWLSFTTEPFSSNIQLALEACFSSFQKTGGDINIGKKLPQILNDVGMKVESIRPIPRIAIPKRMIWHWPRNFLRIYLPKIVETGLLTEKQKEAALKDWDKLETVENAFCQTPQMLEIIARKS